LVHFYPFGNDLIIFSQFGLCIKTLFKWYLCIWGIFGWYLCVIWVAFVYGWYGFAQFGYNVVLTGTLDILFGIAGFNIIPLYYAIKYNIKICD